MANTDSGPTDLKRMRVLIADDNYAFRQGLNVLLGFEQDIEVVAVASNDRQTIDLALKLRPDAIVMDLSMGAISGTEIIRTLATQLPESQVLVLSGHSEKRVIDAALASGAAAYLTKSSSLHEVPVALRQLRDGRGSVEIRPRINPANGGI
jgi:DNA-binding NarL/FixJ family response regulator